MSLGTTIVFGVVLIFLMVCIVELEKDWWL